MIIPAVVQQHADDAAMIAAQRMALVVGPYAGLGRLGQFDRSLMAHLDGLRLSGEEGWGLCEASLEKPSPGVVFAVAARALQDDDETRLGRILALVQAVPDSIAGLLSAFGWLERSRLQGKVTSLLRDPDGFRRMLGIAICAIHRVDPGLVSGKYVQDGDAVVRARAFRAIGELGLSDLLSTCARAFQSDNDPEVRFWAAWSAVLLGDRNVAVDLLISRGRSAGRERARSFCLALQAMEMSAADAVLLDLSRDPQGVRWLIRGSGIVGDPAYVPWLVKRMGELPVARLAGEAFSTIFGMHLGQASLDRPAPASFDSEPSDDPDDPNVDMDPDDGLSWPDVEGIEKWWASNGSQFQMGSRYFMGAPVTRAHCIDVLKNGYQRQRILAAHYLCLLDPGTPLFNTSAPAWRQQKLLAQMV